MRELQAGVWHWEAPHPDWKPSDDWDELVSSYGIDDGERLLLFDPLALPTELEDLAGERKTAIVLTRPWHEGDTRTLVERFDATLFVPSPEEGEPIDGLEQVRESLRAVLELPVKHVLATHGGPSERAALERAVA